MTTLLLPLTIGKYSKTRICATPDSPLGNLAKNFLNIPMIKQEIQKKIAENPGNKTFLKVVDEASKNMTSLLCKPGEVATIFNASAPPYFPSSNKTVNSNTPESNSTLANNVTTVAVQQPQMKKNDSISFKTTLESISPPAGEFLTPPPVTQLDIPQKANFTFWLRKPIMSY